jgi:hemolysin activation/secretion protein
LTKPNRRRAALVLYRGISPLLLIFSLVCLTVGAALAQVAPDAGSTLRQLQEVPPSLPKPAPPSLAPQAAPAAPSADQGASFPVNGYRYSGNTVFDQRTLDALLLDLRGKELTLAQVQEAALRITRHYRERGYLVARAYVPPQEVREGVVEIALLEGRYGVAELANGSIAQDAVIRGHLDRVTAQPVIQQARLDRALLLIRDLAGVREVSATLKPGLATGESILRVETSAAPRATGNVDVDTYGNRFTGIYRLGANLNIASPFGRGDQFGVRLLTSGRGLSSGRLGYQLPLGTDGLKLGLSYAAIRYRLGEEFSSLDATGSAQAASVALSYPLLRTQDANLYATLAGEYKELADDTGNPETQADRRLRSAQFALSGDWRDGGGIGTFALAFSGGKLLIDTEPVAEADAASARSAGSFNKLNYSLLRLQHLGGPLSAYFYLNGQFASQNLDSSEKLSLGGATGVRAYPQGEAAGDEGYLATLEVRWSLPSTSQITPQLVAFADIGEVTRDREPFAPGDNHRRLSGAGIGFNIGKPESFQVRAAWAWKTGSEKALSDHDRNGRGWILLSKYF